MLAPVLCLMLAAVPGTADAATAELEVRHYSLAGVLTPWGDDVAAIRLIPLKPQTGFFAEYEFEEYETQISAELLVDMLVQTVSPEEWEYVGRSISVMEDDDDSSAPWLQVEAPPALQAEVRRFLAYVASVTQRAIVLQVDAFSLPADDRTRLRQLVSNVRFREFREIQEQADASHDASFTLHLTSGVPTSRIAQTRHRFQRGFEVEIAEASAIHAPMIEEYATGVAAALRADLRADGSAIVSFAARNAWNMGRETISQIASHLFLMEQGQSRSDGGGMLESPRVDFVTLAGSLHLRVGETGTAYATSRPIGGRAVVFAFSLVEVGPEPNALQSGDREFILRNLSGEISRGANVRRFSQEALRGVNEADPDDYPLPYAIQIAAMPAEGAQATLERSVDLGLELGRDDVSIGLEGPYVYASGPRGDTRMTMARVLEGLPTSASFPGLEVSLQLEGRAAKESMAYIQSAVGDGFVVCGSQETYVLGHSVEVANRSATFDPKVEALVSGWAGHLRTQSALDQGQRVVELILVTNLRAGGKNTFDSQSKQLPEHHAPVFLTDVIELRRELGPGDALRAGLVRIPDERGDSSLTGTVEISVR